MTWQMAPPPRSRNITRVRFGIVIKVKVNPFLYVMLCYDCSNAYILLLCIASHLSSKERRCFALLLSLSLGREE